MIILIVVGQYRPLADDLYHVLEVVLVTVSPLRLSSKLVTRKNIVGNTFYLMLPIILFVRNFIHASELNNEK